MRASEWIQLASAIAFAIAAWTTTRPLPLRRRWTITALAAIAVAAIALAHLSEPLFSSQHFAVVLDGLTVALFLVPYWQSGQFFLAPNQAIQQRLLAIDRRLLPRVSATGGTGRGPIALTLEMAYLSCYPLVPLGLAAVYAAGRRDKVNGFWLVLLVATHTCYALTPLVPAYPPRSLITDDPATRSANRGRLLNRWILQHGSIHAISFPSAHVASAFAIAFALLFYAPPIGAAFLVIAVMISLGAVIGRYHYALDVILGAATALIAFLGCYRFL